jgi:hypothetical protein
VQTGHRVAAIALAALALSAAPIPETRIAISLPTGWNGDASGRLLVMVEPAMPENAAADSIEATEFGPHASVSTAARDVRTFGAGRQIVIDTDADAFPAGFAQLPPGAYRAQALLDRNGDYGYAGAGPGDLVSKVVTLHLPEAEAVTIPLDHALPDRSAWDFSDWSADAQRAIADTKPRCDEIRYRSAALEAFFGRETTMRALVLRPPGYDADPQRRWPTVYQTGGFGTSPHMDVAAAARIWRLEQAGRIPPMIWVFLDHSGPTGTHEFADSVNNGPWGQALTTELIPSLESRYRMTARADGRFLTGHSSGGWAALWLQIAYPTSFGGSWPISPDPVDFHDFIGVDLYAPDNFYTDQQGHPRPLSRDRQTVTGLMGDFARLETVLGRDGGQFRSFEWVFSPRAADGTPMRLYDRTTGQIDPQVAAYWRDHYDIAARIARDWPRLRPDLDGKIHLTVGTADTFYLDGPAHRLDALLQHLGAHADFTYVPGADHSSVFVRDGDPDALIVDIARAMAATARAKGA